MKHSALSLALLLGTGAACTRMPDQTVRDGVPRDSMPDSLSVPASYGNLVTVTINPAFTDVEQLWFQDGQGRIHLVIYDVHSRDLKRMAPVIGRR